MMEKMIKKADYKRQSSLINISELRNNKIGIIGCGAIGSFTGITIAKMGLTKFLLVDFDKVEKHNLPNQFFTEQNIGELKTRALMNHMVSFNSDVEIHAIGKEFTPNQIKDCQIVISAVDNMEVRKSIFNACKKNKATQLFIDTRMGGLQGQIYTIDMTKNKEKKYYETTLFDNKEAVQLRCTERSIIFTVLGISSMVSNQLFKAFRNEEFRNFIALDYTIPQLI